MKTQTRLSHDPPPPRVLRSRPDMLQVPLPRSPGPEPLRHHFQRLEDVFSREEPRRHAYKYVCWLLSRRVPPGGEDGRNRLLTTARWDENQVRDRVRDLVAGHLASRGTSLVVAEEGFVKKGSSSAGVSRQYCAASRRVDNCQIGVFLLSRDALGNTMAIDRELLIPPRWADGPVARRHADVPETSHGVSREEAALTMIGRALDNGMPVRRVVADAAFYGDSAAFRRALERRRVPYVLASSRSGPLVSQRTAPDGYVHWQFARREGGSYLCYVPAHTDLGDCARTAAATDLCVRSHFASARQEAGLDRYSARKWRAWYRHMTLAMFAHAVLRIDAARPLSPC
ncbi:IS701 family transposase [Streptomyces xinghaiensis]|uniref:IS701 family transposase n=1 Tax=Streptomyces xinghaiensis TaxID=1038928 RepID=UPI0034432D83